MSSLLEFNHTDIVNIAWWVHFATERKGHVNGFKCNPFMIWILGMDVNCYFAGCYIRSVLSAYVISSSRADSTCTHWGLKNGLVHFVQQSWRQYWHHCQLEIVQTGYNDYLEVEWEGGVFEPAFRARMRTSLTVKIKTFLQREDKICVLTLWHIALIQWYSAYIEQYKVLISISHILTLFCMCLLICLLTSLWMCRY